MIAKFDLSAIWLEVDPEAREAFERLVRDHGRQFAELAREYILTQKYLGLNQDECKLPHGAG